MGKTVYIGQNAQGYYLEVFGKDEDGVGFRKRTSSEETIKSYLDYEGVHFIDAIVKENDLYLYTAEKNVFILKSYRSLLTEKSFSSFFRRILKAPVVARNFKNGEHSSNLQQFGLKLLYMNRKKLATLALAGTLLVSNIPTFFHSSSPVVFNDISTNIEMEDTLAFEQNNQSSEELSLDMIYDYRIEQTMRLQEQYYSSDSSKIMLGSKVDLQVEAMMEGEYGKTIFEVAKTYGVDPYLLIAKGITESSLDHEACIPGGSRYNGYGVGVFQLENPDGREVKAWNFQNGCEDSLLVTMENATDFRKNTEAAAMYLQNRLELYNGNVYLALQSYNYGPAMMKIVIHDYAKKMGITEEEVKNNISDLGWLEIVKDIHENPNDYYYRVKISLDETDPNIIRDAKEDYVWKQQTYGNDRYIADVLSYYVGEKCLNKNLNGENVVTDLKNGQMMVLSSSISEESKVI